MADINHQIHLVSRPSGEASADNFRLFEQPVGTPGEGQVLVRHHFLSLDPYMRGRMDDAKSYAQPQPLDKVMQGGTVGVVVASKHPDYKPGDNVVGFGGWQEYSIVDAGIPGSLRKVDTSKRAALGLPRRGRHARRHRLVRPDEDLPAEGGPDDRRQRCQRRRRQRGRPARQGARLPRGRHRRRRRQVRVRDARARLRRLRRLQGARRSEVALPGA